ncbi:hypothetical protein B0H14DRAFT_2785855 [Mycena olivaceomarginata]|nr:hypothetical protein B0H14DRAFT_2785855 [Mycena olivaceomarginata]
MTFPAMDSELLVSASPPVHLTFSDNSMINATLYRVSPHTSELLARITRRSILPDLITFPNHDGGKEMRLSKWMRRCMLPDGSHAHGVETEMGNCLLKIHPVHRLALYTERDPGTPIAHWERATATSPLSLVLYPGTENFYPKIIAAFTVSELKMRNAEQTDSSRRWS